jgi:hypothetical protein
MRVTEDVDNFHFLATFLKLIRSRSERMRAFCGVVIEWDVQGILELIDVLVRCSLLFATSLVKAAVTFRFDGVLCVLLQP